MDMDENLSASMRAGWDLFKNHKIHTFYLDLKLTRQHLPTEIP